MKVGMTLALATMLLATTAQAKGLSVAERRLADRLGTLNACEDVYKKRNKRQRAKQAEEKAEDLLRRSIRVDGVNALQVIRIAERVERNFDGGLAACNRAL